MNKFNYKRRATCDVHIGNVVLGSSHLVVVQSMTTTNTLDTEKSVEQAKKIIDVGGQLVRLTAQGIREAENLKNIREQLSLDGYDVPLSADIHFNPNAANVAAKYVEKVRINPGNFVDGAKTFKDEDSEEAYNEGLKKIKEKFVVLLDKCKEFKTSIRIGVNHGSLSDRIMSRYGDTPEGMVASCMEFLRIAHSENFEDIVISMKASNTVLMTKSVRLLVREMEKEGFNYPLHLGVTEAGNESEGRIKSAVGIGSLLADGIGDTIRVSLSEDPEHEIPVARSIVDYVQSLEGHEPIIAEEYASFDPISMDRRETRAVGNIGGDFPVIAVAEEKELANISSKQNPLPEYVFTKRFLSSVDPEIRQIVEWENYDSADTVSYPLFDSSNWKEISQCDAEIKFLELSYPDLSTDMIRLMKDDDKLVLIVTSNHQNRIGEVRAFFHRLMIEQCDIPVIIRLSYNDSDEELQIKSSIDFGSLFLDGFGNGIFIVNANEENKTDVILLEFAILQASRLRTTKTEFISCPGCGRTLFGLQSTVEKIKKVFGHLSHLKIGVMGCIVNGIGEMADADYGYVGAGPGKVSLYKKKECIERGIPSEEAVEKLIALIKENGDWIEPPIH